MSQWESYSCQRPACVISKENSFTISYSSPMNMITQFAPPAYPSGLAISIISTYTSCTCKYSNLPNTLLAGTLWEYLFQTYHPNNQCFCAVITYLIAYFYKIAGCIHYISQSIDEQRFNRKREIPWHDFIHHIYPVNIKWTVMSGSVYPDN